MGGGGASYIEMILDEIINYKKIEIEARKKGKPYSALEKEIAKKSNPKVFLKKSEKIQLIAELKKASPSRGIIREDFKPVELAKICEEAGASALSILTEEKFFKGKLEYIPGVRDAVGLPILRKDFIIDEYQILESRANGADAILLLTNILKPKIIQRFLGLSKDFGLSAIVEVHSPVELNVDAEIIGINNRDLRTFRVDIRNTERIILKIPKDKIIVSESGISNRKDVEYLQGLGVDAVLVGESIMACKDVAGKIRELLGYGES